MTDRVVVGVADAIEALRVELSQAILRGDGHDLRFELDPIELTIQVAVTKGADGKIGWTMLGLGGSYEAVTTQTLKLRLTPARSVEGGTPSKVLVEAPVAGDEQQPGRR